MARKKTIVLASLVACLVFLGGLSPAFGRESQPSASLQPQVRVSLNKASLEELQTIKGVGPVIAQRILDYRNVKGPFRSIEDLAQVNGIGEAKYEKIKEQLTL